MVCAYGNRLTTFEDYEEESEYGYVRKGPMEHMMGAMLDIMKSVLEHIAAQKAYPPQAVTEAEVLRNSAADTICVEEIEENKENVRVIATVAMEAVSPEVEEVAMSETVVEGSAQKTITVVTAPAVTDIVEVAAEHPSASVDALAIVP